MFNFPKAFNKYLYAWAITTLKTGWKYGKYVSLKQLHGYDDYVYYTPRVTVKP